jgi:hypothetical protein
MQLPGSAAGAPHLPMYPVGPTTSTLTWLAGLDLYAWLAAAAEPALACTHTLRRLRLTAVNCC